MRQLHKQNLTILLIVFLQVCLEWFIITRVDRSHHIFCPFVQERQHTVIHKIVNQHNPLLRTPYQVRHISPCIPHAACSKYMLRQLLRKTVLDCGNNPVYFLICFRLVLLYMKDTLHHQRIVIHDVWYCCESTHDTNINLNSRFCPQYTTEHSYAVASENMREKLPMLTTSIL